jgi:hypothetical protein
MTVTYKGPPAQMVYLILSHEFSSVGTAFHDWGSRWPVASDVGIGARTINNATTVAL